MNFLEALLIPPSVEHVVIAKYSILILSLLFVPYISILVGSTLFSLIMTVRAKTEGNPMFARFGGDMMQTLTGTTGLAIILGILTVLTLGLSFSQVMYGAGVKISQYFLITLLSTVASIILVTIYKNSFSYREEKFGLHAFWGVLAFGSLNETVWCFVSSVSVLLWPEKWPLIDTIIPLTFDWNVIARFNHFMTAALALTGGAILFFFFNWNGGKEGVEGEYRAYVKKFGVGMAITFTIIQALFFLWYIGTLPVMAKSYAVYYSAVIGVLFMFGICYFVWSYAQTDKLQYSTISFVLFLIFFLVVLKNEEYARETSLSYQTYALERLDHDTKKKIEEERVARSGAVASLEIGETLYNSKCIACHQFDQKMVGPPYNAVLPKYEGNMEKLKEFILNPVKVDPEYIPMPNQGLKPHEAESAAMYLLQKYEESK